MGIRKFFTGFAGSNNSTTGVNTPAQDTANEEIFTTVEEASGHYAYSPDALLSSAEFKPLVDKISVAMGGDSSIFEKYLKPSIMQVALYAQKIPAAESIDGRPSNVFGHHMSEGGLLLHSLETMYFALNDSRLAFFNKGITPSKRAQNLTSARVACGLAGLLHDIGKIDDPIIVTYKDGKEYQYQCVESIPEFLSHVHGIELNKVYKTKSNPKPPIYVIKGWKKGRSDKHMFIGPFLMRNFLSKGTMKLLSLGEQSLLTDFMTCIDWDVLTGEYTNSRVNNIYRIMNGADKTSSTKDRKAMSNTNSLPLEATFDTKNKITEAFQFLTDSGEISVNQDKQCYIYSHALPPKKTDPSQSRFVLLLRCDDPAFGMFCKVFAKASEFARTDILQEHEPNFKNFIELLKQCDLLQLAPTADGMFTVKRHQETFKAICIQNWNSVIRPNGRLYRAQENDFLELKLEFADGIEPVIKKNPNSSKEPDLSSDLSSGESTRTTKKEKETKQESVKEVQKENAEQNLTSKSVTTDVTVSKIEPTDEELLEGASEVDTEPAAEEIKAPAAFSGGKSFVPNFNVKKTKKKETNNTQNEELIKDLRDLYTNPDLDVLVTPLMPVTKAVIKPELTAENVPPAVKTQIIEDEIEANRPEVFEEGQIRNFDKAIHDEKEKQKVILNEQRINAMRHKDFPAKEQDSVYNSTSEPWYDGINCKAVEAIKEICGRIEDPKCAKEFSLQICNRLKYKFSYIDFVTADNHYCYAVFLWNDEIKKDANAVQLIKMFQKNNLFPTPVNEIESNTMEIFYFGHVQMIRAVTKIFFLANFSPVKINCREHPYEKIYHKPVTATALIEYLKHRIIALDRQDVLYGYKARGYAHEASGRHINKNVLRACYKEYGESDTGYSNITRLLSITKQITPPYMIIDGDDLVVGYKKTIKDSKDNTKSNTSSKSSEEFFAMPFGLPL